MILGHSVTKKLAKIIVNGYLVFEQSQKNLGHFGLLMDNNWFYLKFYDNCKRKKTFYQ